ncbi:MAG: hypothetical protein PF495_16115, partial [Spirochaetales bacterium]|nr:hypothetical protein [Spirochaetales bacterium]
RSKTVYVKVVHTGTGSTELPLTEKIREIQRMYGQIPTQMSFNADFSSYIGGLTSLAMTIHSLRFKAASFAWGHWRPVGYAAGQMAESLSRVFRKAVKGDTAGPAFAPGRGVSIGEININIAGAQAPQTPEDWRLIVRQYIIPEIERIGYA